MSNSLLSTINKKRLCKTTRCEVMYTVCGYIMLIIGGVLIIQTEKKNIFNKKSLTVIYTSYENAVCSFNSDCLSIKYDNGCRKYYTPDNKDTFKCSYLNVVFGEENNNDMLCSINHFEKGFYYPEVGEIWYNSTYINRYNIVNVGDTLDLWYSDEKGECIFNYDKSNYATGIVLLVIGLILILSTCGNPRNRVHITIVNEHKKKATNFIEFEEA